MFKLPALERLGVIRLPDRPGAVIPVFRRKKRISGTDTEPPALRVYLAPHPLDINAYLPGVLTCIPVNKRIIPDPCNHRRRSLHSADLLSGITGIKSPDSRINNEIIKRSALLN